MGAAASARLHEMVDKVGNLMHYTTQGSRTTELHITASISQGMILQSRSLLFLSTAAWHERQPFFCASLFTLGPVPEGAPPNSCMSVRPTVCHRLAVAVGGVTSTSLRPAGLYV